MRHEVPHVPYYRRHCDAMQGYEAILEIVEQHPSEADETARRLGRLLSTALTFLPFGRLMIAHALSLQSLGLFRLAALHIVRFPRLSSMPGFCLQQIENFERASTRRSIRCHDSPRLFNYEMRAAFSVSQA